jgi:nitrogen regulatory protein PII
MKNVAIIIQPNRFDGVREKLIAIGVCGMTITNVEGFGYEKKQMDVMRGKDYSVELAPKIKIEIALNEADVDMVVNAVLEETRTGRLGDGKIFINDLSDVIRIRTDERKEHAL